MQEVRPSAVDERLIAEAASLSVQTFSSFALDEAVARAREVESHWSIRLADDVYDRLLEALDAPPERNPALVELAQRAVRFRRI